jgi:hypothetical protein
MSTEIQLLIELGRALNRWEELRTRNTTSPTESGQHGSGREALRAYTEAEEMKKKVIEYARRLAATVDQV